MSFWKTLSIKEVILGWLQYVTLSMVKYMLAKYGIEGGIVYIDLNWRWAIEM